MKNDNLPNSKEFFEADKKGDVKKVASLLEAGIDPNLEDKDGDTALHLASKNGDLKLVKLLIENGANVSCLKNFQRKGK